MDYLTPAEEAALSTAMQQAHQTAFREAIAAKLSISEALELGRAASYEVFYARFPEQRPVEG